jgi:hypothetical protein
VAILPPWLLFTKKDSNKIFQQQAKKIAHRPSDQMGDFSGLILN